MLFVTRQKHYFARFTLILVLKTDRLDKCMSTGTFVLLLMKNLAGDHTLLAHVKQFQKICICCHSSDTLWTLLNCALISYAIEGALLTSGNLSSEIAPINLMLAAPVVKCVKSFSSNTEKKERRV